MSNYRRTRKVRLKLKKNPIKSEIKQNICIHVDNIEPLKVGKSVMIMENWKCNQKNCDSLIGLQSCIKCGKIFCSQFKCINKHSIKRGHSVFIDINTYKVYCYKCDFTVRNDTRCNDIKTLKESLVIFHEQKRFDVHSLRSGKEVKHVNGNENNVIISQKRAKKIY
mmetsp:Transcript_35069/g.43305  ORF Transcript_35069/g.43305 Transcript_35069/m.43305 type:complete len:166 (-) Transcript_35069:258-755(-)